MSARALSIILCLCACSSSHWQRPTRGETPRRGFTDTPVSGGVFHVTFADFEPSGRTAGDEPEPPLPGDFMLLHGAELAAAKGYTFFTVADERSYSTVPPWQEREVYFSSQFTLQVSEATVSCFTTNPNPTGLVYKASDVIAALGRNTWLANIRANAARER